MFSRLWACIIMHCSGKQQTLILQVSKGCAESIRSFILHIDIFLCGNRPLYPTLRRRQPICDFYAGQIQTTRKIVFPR